MPASQTANPIAVVQEDNATFAQIKNFDEEIESLNHIISHDHESEANELVHPEIEILAETTCSVQIGKAVDRIISLQDDKTVYQRASVEPAEIVDQDIGSQVRGNVSPIASLDPSEAVTMSIGIDQQIDAFTQVSYSGQESVVAQVVSTQKETEMQGQDAEIPSSESLAESQESMSGVVVHDVHPLLSTESPARQMESQTKSSDALQSPSTMFTTSAIDQIGGEISLVASQSPAQRSVIVANTLPNYLQDTQASASKRALRSANKAPRTPSSSRAKTAQSAKRPGNLQSLLENVSVKKSRTAPTTQHSSPRSSKQLDQIKPASFLSTEMFWRELDSFVKTAAPAVPVDKNTSATLAERFAYTPTDPAKKSASPVPAPRTPALSGSPRTVSFGPPVCVFNPAIT